MKKFVFFSLFCLTTVILYAQESLNFNPKYKSVTTTNEERSQDGINPRDKLVVSNTVNNEIMISALKAGNVRFSSSLDSEAKPELIQSDSTAEKSIKVVEPEK